MSKVKGLLSTDWNRSAVDILREELENLDKDQTKTFFESAATLMANQVRELIEQSVNSYVSFIQRYKFPTYPKPEEIILREYDADTPFRITLSHLSLPLKAQELISSPSSKALSLTFLIQFNLSLRVSLMLSSREVKTYQDQKTPSPEVIRCIFGMSKLMMNLSLRPKKRSQRLLKKILKPSS